MDSRRARRAPRETRPNSKISWATCTGQTRVSTFDGRPATLSRLHLQRRVQFDRGREVHSAARRPSLRRERARRSSTARAALLRLLRRVAAVAAVDVAAVFARRPDATHVNPADATALLEYSTSKRPFRFTPHRVVALVDRRRRAIVVAPPRPRVVVAAARLLVLARVAANEDLTARPRGLRTPRRRQLRAALAPVRRGEPARDAVAVRVNGRGPGLGRLRPRERLRARLFPRQREAQV